MNAIDVPWLEISILIPLVGAGWISLLRDHDAARKWSVGICIATVACCLSGWLDYASRSAEAESSVWSLVYWLTGRRGIALDTLNAPLVSLAALLYLLTVVSTLPSKVRRFPFALALLSESVVLATLSCQNAWGIVVLLALGTVPPYVELRARQRSTRVYVIHMTAFIALLIAGWACVTAGAGSEVRRWALVPLLLGVLIRSGIVPFHCWMTDLFEQATFGSALLFVTPIPAAYATTRLILPIAPVWVLQSLGVVSLITAIYAAGMALVQRESRRFFCYIFLSHSALVLVGLETVTPIGLTGALSVWLSVGLALAGFGLTLRALESRTGALTLTRFHGLYEHTPALAICFLLTGLASVGFPGTFGFLGTEMLVDGAVQVYPHIGVAVVVAAALNGIAIVQAYFRLFTGTRHAASVPLRVRRRERFAVLLLAALILGGGLFPQPGVLSRHRATEDLLQQRLEAGLAVAEPAEHETRR